MAALEAAAISLGAKVAKVACGVWLGDHKVAAELSGGLIEVAAERLTSMRERRQFRRVWDQIAELVADRLEPLVIREFRDLPEHERLAAVAAVGRTFEVAVLTEADLFAQDLDAGFLDRHLRGQDPARVDRAGLSTDAAGLYDLVLRECCAYTIELARTLPQAGVLAMTEVLRRERQVLDDLRVVLERLPERRGTGDFERDYRQLVANQLDQVDLFGATLSDTSRRYPLSVAYLGLTVSGAFTFAQRGPEPSGPGGMDGKPSVTPTAPVEEVLAVTRRLFVRGQAGIGKTTLLQWIAVQSARSSFPSRLAAWNGVVPFFVPLRRHAGRDLPPPERFISEVGRHIAAEMPAGWVHDQLRSGRAVVLVDGVDELAEHRRDDARRWLRQLVHTFPEARYVVTSRPAAAPGDWLGRERFQVVELQPMGAANIPVFVRRWHDAMREQAVHPEVRAELDSFESHLLSALQSRRHLRQLAGYPLLCALLCALHRDRRGHLPNNRMELYEVALHMMLERRDSERRIEPGPVLSRTEKSLLLRDLAYWLIRNDWWSAPSERVRERIGAKLRAMPQITASPVEVYRVLLERSGLLREPVDGQTDFVHRSFQEYLAAAEATAEDDIGALVGNAWTDLWSDMVVMAAGHASPAQRAELLRGLLTRAAECRDKNLSDALRLVAVACLETSPELEPALRLEIEKAAATLLPPRTIAAAESLARTGSFALDLLDRVQPRTAREAIATIRAAARIADPSALPLLARFQRDTRRGVLPELLAAWPSFDPEEYARVVLHDASFDQYDRGLRISRPELIPALRHLSRLTRLTYDGHEPRDLSFLRDLPQLRELQIRHEAMSDLSGLAGTHLESVWIYGPFDPSAAALELRHTSRMPALRSLGVWGRPVTGVGNLKADLAAVTLCWLSAQDVEQLAVLRGLAECEVAFLDWLTALDPLLFLNAPIHLRVNDCPHLRDLRGLALWSHSLRSLNLAGCPSLDLSPLCHLEKLSRLVLTTDGLDLGPLSRLTTLETVSFAGDEPVDLTPLRHAPGLTQLWLGRRPEVDLTPLAGRRGLTVYVSRSTRVAGAGRLGPRSKIVRIR